MAIGESFSIEIRLAMNISTYQWKILIFFVLAANIKLSSIDKETINFKNILPFFAEILFVDQNQRLNLVYFLVCFIIFKTADDATWRKSREFTWSRFVTRDSGYNSLYSLELQFRFYLIPCGIAKQRIWLISADMRFGLRIWHLFIYFSKVELSWVLRHTSTF